jgi:hypothetical protein
MFTNQNPAQNATDATAQQQAAAAQMSNTHFANNGPDKNLFDRWLTEKLHTVFDNIAQEPLPPDLLKLVQQLEDKEKAAGT